MTYVYVYRVTGCLSGFYSMYVGIYLIVSTKNLHSITNCATFQLCWRPRPPSMLSKEQIKDIKKNLKKYSDQFNAKDKMRQSKASKELVSRKFHTGRRYYVLV